MTLQLGRRFTDLTLFQFESKQEQRNQKSKAILFGLEESEDTILEESRLEGESGFHFSLNKLYCHIILLFVSILDSENLEALVRSIPLDIPWKRFSES